MNGEDFEILTRVVSEGIHLVRELELEDRIKVGESISRAGYFVDQETRELPVARGISETTINDTAEIFERNLAIQRSQKREKMQLQLFMEMIQH